jgi:hypothetical protein
MSSGVTIPEDIMDTARRAWPTAREEGVAIHMTIARAILAERQRCADACLKLSEHQKSRGQFQDAFTSNFIAQQLLAGAHTA